MYGHARLCTHVLHKWFQRQSAMMMMMMMIIMMMMMMRRFQTSVDTNISADESCRQLLNTDLEELPFL